MHTEELIKKSRLGDVLSKKELVYLLGLAPDSAETYMVMAEATRLSKELSDGKAEVHAQFAINLAPCPCDCLFCSFAKINGVFNEALEIAPEHAVAYARQFEIDGANAVFMMSTAKYPFERYIEISKEVRKNLKPETTFIANIGDQTLKNAAKLKDTGFSGVYHAVRLREGKDTTLSVEKRKQSINNFKEAGLEIGTCVVPPSSSYSGVTKWQLTFKRLSRIISLNISKVNIIIKFGAKSK